jgi:Putative Ig domain
VILSGGFGFFGGLGNYGTLTIENSTISGNTAHVGGGVINRGTLTIKNSTISNNTTNYGSGGVTNSGTLAIKNSTISGNDSYYFGGGVGNSGTLTIENSTISGNTAFGGGGVYNCCSPYSSTKIINSTISGNSAVNGGGVFNHGSGLTLTNSTISGNAADAGGGLANSAITGSAYDCQFINCSPGTISLDNSLIAGNQATVAAEVENTSIVSASSFNLFGSDGNAGVSGFTPGPTDIVPSVSLAQILGPLQNNGGPTDTHALIAGSPAIDAGDPGGCRDSQGALLRTDQRGFARHVDGNNDGTVRCDIGALEFGAESVPIPVSLAATTLATGEVGISFTSDLMISGGVAPYVVSITKGKLPAGLTLGNDGIISGIISRGARSAEFTVRITDSLNDSVSETFNITVLRAVHIAGRLKRGRVGKDYSDSLKTRGGLGPFNWSITSGALPPGLSFNTTTGAIAGVPEQAGEFPLTVQVSDALGGVAVENLTLKIR